MRLTVKRFDPSSIKQHRIILMVGKRGTGKSVLMEDILYHLNDKLDFGIAMTPTESTAESFRKHMPEQWIYAHFDAAKLDSMLRMQRDLVKRKKAKSLFLCMDDCMFDKRVLKGLGMRDLFFNGRHLHVTLINAMQYVMDMGPDLRSQVDYVFALRENIISNKQKLWKYFYGMFDNFNDFNKVLNKCTENHGALVLDNTSKTNQIEDCVFWYRASNELGNFKLGKPKYWLLAERMSKSESKRRSDERERRIVDKEQQQRHVKRGITNVAIRDENGNVLSDSADSDVCIE